MFFLEKIAHLFCWILGKTLLRFFFRFEVKNIKNIRGLKGSLIIAFNHCSWLDPLIINACFSPGSKITPIHFATSPKYYWNPIFLPLMIMAGAFPVYRGIGLKKTLKKGLKILREGGVVGIAPEGRRRHLGRPRKGRRGVSFLALRTNAPVLPVYIEGAVGLKIIETLLRKKKIITKIGKPFYLSPRSGKEKANLTSLSNMVMEKIYQLKNVD
jgi:1-acyl-sn-glycerol-3-phosphate acyltransferase